MCTIPPQLLPKLLHYCAKVAAYVSAVGLAHQIEIIFCGEKILPILGRRQAAKYKLRVWEDMGLRRTLVCVVL